MKQDTKCLQGRQRRMQQIQSGTIFPAAICSVGAISHCPEQLKARNGTNPSGQQSGKTPGPLELLPCDWIHFPGHMDLKF